MPDTTTNASYPGARNESITPVMREVAELMISRKNLSPSISDTPQKLYRALFVQLMLELRHATEIRDPKDNRHEKWVRDMALMNKIKRDFSVLRPPVIPTPFLKPMTGDETHLYQVKLGNRHIGDILANDIERMLPSMLAPETDNAYWAAMLPLGAAYIEVGGALDRWGKLDIDREVQLGLSTFSSATVEQTLKNAVDVTSMEDRTEEESENEDTDDIDDFGMAEQ